MPGQFTIVALVMTLVMIIVYSQLYPVIETFLTPLILDSDPATAALLTMLPFFIAIAIIMSVIWYIVPQKR
jgi:uncharacterized membrane protein YedE/YeeE